MATDPRYRCPRHRRGPQKSHRGGGTPVGRRSVENQNRPAPPRRVRLNQLVSSRGTERRTRLTKQLKPLWNAGAARSLTCSESLRVRRLRLGAPKFLFHPHRIDQIAAATAVASTDRSKSRWKTKPTSQTGRGSVPEANPQPEFIEPMT